MSIKIVYQTSDTAQFYDKSQAEKREKLIEFAASMAKRIWYRDMEEKDLAFQLKDFFQNQSEELAFLFDLEGE